MENNLNKHTLTCTIEPIPRVTIITRTIVPTNGIVTRGILLTRVRVARTFVDVCKQKVDLYRF